MNENYNGTSISGTIGGYEFRGKTSLGKTIVIETNEGVRGIGIRATASCFDGKWKVKSSSFTFSVKEVYLEKTSKEIIFKEE